MAGNVLPLAITMMAGPQIMSAIVFITGDDPVRKSFAFVVGVPIAMSVGILVFMGLAGLFDDTLRDEAEPSTAAKVIQIALVGLLIAAAIKAYLGRETAEPPKWLGGLQQASAGRAFALGLLLLSLFPSDFTILLTVGVNLASNDVPFTHALPLIGLTTLIAALPVLSYLLFRRRAEVAMPKVRDWMNSNSWLINIFVYAIFIFLILG
jgi:hypothetical protein